MFSVWETAGEPITGPLVLDQDRTYYTTVQALCPGPEWAPLVLLGSPWGPRFLLAHQLAKRRFHRYLCRHRIPASQNPFAQQPASQNLQAPQVVTNPT